jgi:hypothetical protein
MMPCRRAQPSSTASGTTPEDSPALIEDFLTDAEGSVFIANSEKRIPLIRHNTLTVIGSKLSMYQLPNSHIEVHGETQLAVLNNAVLTTSYWGKLPETYQAAIIGSLVLVILAPLIARWFNRRRR